MIKLLAFAVLVAGFGVFVSSAGDENMLGPGIWQILTAQRCDNHEDYILDFDIKRSRINRTSESFKLKMLLPMELTKEFAIRIDICKQADGGCKPYQVMSDDSLCGFANKHAEKNFQNILLGAGIESGECPIPAGEYELDHIMDYNDLPQEAIYGVFGAKVIIIKDYEDIACIATTIEFKKDDGDDDD